MLLLRRAAASSTAPFFRVRGAASAQSAAKPTRTPKVASLLAEARTAAAERELAAVKQLVSSKEALVESLKRELSERLVEKDAVVESFKRELSERLVEKDAVVELFKRELSERLVEKDALFGAAAKAHTIELATSKHTADVAKSRLSVRAILETSIVEAFADWLPPHDDAKTTSERLQTLLDSQKGCPGLKAYVRVAAIDNGVPPDDALKEARKLYASFCSRAHSDAPEGTAGISSVVFDNAGRTALVAYAAIVHYTGRSISMYAVDDWSATLPLKMRTLRDCKATEAMIRASPLLVGIQSL
jgi:hypothetical protein